MQAFIAQAQESQRLQAQEAQRLLAQAEADKVAITRKAEDEKAALAQAAREREVRDKALYDAERAALARTVREREAKIAADSAALAASAQQQVAKAEEDKAALAAAAQQQVAKAAAETAALAAAAQQQVAKAEADTAAVTSQAKDAIARGELQSAQAQEIARQEGERAARAKADQEKLELQQQLDAARREVEKVRTEADRAIAKKDQMDKAKRAAERQRMSDSWDQLKGQFEEKVQLTEARLRKEQEEKQSIVADLERQERAVKSLEKINADRSRSVPPPAQQCGDAPDSSSTAQPHGAHGHSRAASVPPEAAVVVAPAQPAADAPPPAHPAPRPPKVRAAQSSRTRGAAGGEPCYVCSKPRHGFCIDCGGPCCKDHFNQDTKQCTSCTSKRNSPSPEDEDTVAARKKNADLASENAALRAQGRTAGNS